MVTNKVLRDDAVFTALAHPIRRRLLAMLATKPAAVHELSRRFRVSRPAISRHLRILRGAELVRVEKRSTENIYVLEAERLRLVETWLKQFWSARLFDLKSLAEGSWRDRET